MKRFAPAVPLMIVVSFSLRVPSGFADDAAIFEKPIRLKADGQFIDTGNAWGHSGPSLADVGDDGLRDLVVGDFSGKFRVYRNVGTNQRPKFGQHTFLVAGGVPAQVRIYCCIGSSPQFFDFDGDGHLDMISGSYDPGACYLFRGLGNGRYAARETIIDKSGAVILRNAKMEVTRSFGSWPTMVDWNNDGRLDLVIGGFDGGIRVWLNEGTAQKPQFAIDYFAVQAAGKPIAVPGGHAAPVIVDWDGDGRWDIVSGSERGAVVWYRNIGKPGVPSFAAAQVLVPEHRGYGYEEFLDLNAEPVPGIRSQIAAADFDGDGRIDLLLGDFSSTISPRPDLTPVERAELSEKHNQQQETIARLHKQLDDLHVEIKRRYPGDKFHTRAADEEWGKMYKAMQDSRQRKELITRLGQFDSALRRYVAKPNGHSSDGFATDHGYVWLFRRKPSGAGNPSVVSVPNRDQTDKIAPREPSSREPVVAEAIATPKRAKRGDIVTLTIQVGIAAGWHIQTVGHRGLSIPTRLDLKLPSGITAVGDWELPEAEVGDPKTGPMYQRDVTFRRKLKVASEAPKGDGELKCDFEYQACDEHQCLRPAKAELHAAFTVLSP